LRILAIETATPSVGCALWDEGGPVASFMLVGRQRHAEVLMPAIDDLCRQAGWSVADLTGVAVDRGPGLFTGLRVGLATARAIAAACRLPAAGVTSLEALAHRHRRRTGLLVPVVDARRGEVYWALYHADGASLRELRPPAVASPETLATELAELDGNAMAVGDGASRYKEVLVNTGAVIADEGEMWPSALAVAELGAPRLAGRAPGPSDELPAPLYLRQADVRIGWDQVGGRATAETAGRPGQHPGPAERPAAAGFADALPDGPAAASPSTEPKLAP
jgi:tRNA threonylcarbamoyladenosine biosynthesis protein TsaB